MMETYRILSELEGAPRMRGIFMAWSDEELKSAELVHGPSRNLSDTYRLTIKKPDGTERRLDVPGFMVGDGEGAKLRMRAAAIIRDRLLK